MRESEAQPEPVNGGEDRKTGVLHLTELIRVALA